MSCLSCEFWLLIYSNIYNKIFKENQSLELQDKNFHTTNFIYQNLILKIEGLKSD